MPPEEMLPDAGPPTPKACELAPMGQTVSTFAGCTDSGTADGPRGTARFHNPTNVSIGANGITYVTDFDSHRIRAIDMQGSVSTVYQAENFKNPFGIVPASGGKLYIQTDDNDRGEHSTETGTIWLFDPIARTAQVIARDLGRPRGLVVLPDGRIAMADYMHHVVSILDPQTAKVTLLAGARDQKGYANGSGADARFAQPYDLVLLGGDLVVADMENRRLRRVAFDGTVSDYAGTGQPGKLDGPCAVATFDAPQSLALLPDGTLFVGDVQRKVIRKIASCNVSTIAGDGTPGWLDAAEPRNARFYGLEGLDVDGTRLIAADGNVGDGKGFHHVRLIELTKL